ncbi:MAG: hypothetical protein U0586_16990 [Candidatus Brocadiaceae bacterium]
MAVFQYNAVDNRGKAVKDRIEASTSDEAIVKIRGLGYFPTNIKEIRVHQKSGETSTTNTPSKQRGEISSSLGGS